MKTNQPFFSNPVAGSPLLPALTLHGGKPTHGFAFVAYPAEYRNSGVMTFVVNQSGIVYQKDLGAQTADIASVMQEYNPGSGWERVE